MPVEYDSWISQIDQALNFGADPVLQVSRAIGEWGAIDKVALLRFDLHTMPAKSWITHALLEFYQNKGASHQVVARKLESTWSEETVTWLNAPAMSDPGVPAAELPGEAGWMAYDVTALVQKWNAIPFSNFGMALRGATVGWRELSSQEGAHPPRLQLRYIIDKQPPTVPTYVNADPPAHHWSNNNTVSAAWYGASDGEGSGVYGYTFVWDDKPSTIPGTAGLTQLASTTSPPLPDGDQWWLHVRTRDGVSNWSADAAHFGPFKIDTQKPPNPVQVTSDPPPATWSNKAAAFFAWPPVSEPGGSGVRGYAQAWDHNPGTVPAIDPATLNAWNSKSVPLGEGKWYFHVRTADWAGNAADGAAHSGEIWIDRTKPVADFDMTSWTIHSTNVPLKWHGSDDASGIGRFELMWRETTVGIWVVENLGLATSKTFVGADGTTYRMKLRAVDKAGNAGDWTWEHELRIATVDAEAVSLEVTQGIQNLANDMPLVASKRTFVRFHLRSNSTTEPAVRGGLEGYRGGKKLGALLPGNAGGTITARRNPSRGQLQDSLWFELPPEWTVNGDLLLKAEVRYAGYDWKPTNNTISLTVPFHNAVNLCMEVFNVIPVLPSDWSSFPVYTPGSPDFWQQLAVLEQLYPLEGGVKVYTGGWVYPWPGFEDPWNLATLDGFNKALTRLFAIECQYSDPPCWTAFTVGMIHPAWNVGGDGTSGLGLRPGRHSVAAMWNILGSPEPFGGALVAHEIGHNLNRLHIPCTHTEPGPLDLPWAGVDQCRIADNPGPSGDTYFGFAVSPTGGTLPEVIGPTDAADFMTYDNDVWVSDYTYRKLLDVFVYPSAAAAGQAALPDAWLAAGDYLLAAGTITPTGETAQFGVFYRMPQPKLSLLRDSWAHEQAEAASYRLTLEDASGAVLRSHPFTPAASSWGGPEPGPLIFGELIPYEAATRRIRLLRDGTPIAVREVSSHTPTVRILSPSGGESLSAELHVAWQASDADPGDTLRFAVRYSADDGETWRPLVVDWADTSLDAVGVEQLPGSEQARIEVAATDGVNTARATSAAFRMARRAPSAYILAPAPDARIMLGESLRLSGRSLDAEDGMLAGERLTWSTAISGTLGAGAELLAPSLPEGRHLIRLTARDSDGMQASAEVLVTVAGWSRAYVPVILRAP